MESFTRNAIAQTLVVFRGAVKQQIQTKIMMTTTVNSQRETLNNMTIVAIVSHPVNLMQYHELVFLSSHQLTKQIKACTEETYAPIYGTGPIILVLYHFTVAI